MGWATPLGRSLTSVFQSVIDGRPPAKQWLENPFSKKSFPVLRVPPDTVSEAAGLPRLRRSSSISHFAVTAASDAMAAAGLPGEALARTALIFAASDGGVVYTRRFYADVTERGPGAGSPLLFPETVYNAPASHIAARLGIEGTALSLVGDAAAALSAIFTATELLETHEADYCLVVGSQELDWITCDAYTRWNRKGDTIYSEGAAAILLGREDQNLPVLKVHSGATYKTRRDACLRLEEFCDDLLGEESPDLVVSSAANNDLGEVERRTLSRRFPNAAFIELKAILGETHATSTLQQVIIAALAGSTGKRPTALVPAVGFNGQMSALVLTPSKLQA